MGINPARKCSFTKCACKVASLAPSKQLGENCWTHNFASLQQQPCLFHEKWKYGHLSHATSVFFSYG